MASIRTRTALALCAALSTLSALSGCDQGGGNTPAPTTSAHAGFGGATTTPAADTPAAATPTVTDVTGADETIFRTPSKNIVCALNRSAVRCDIAQNKWKLPAKPADCEFDWGNGIYLQAGTATFTCASDSLLGAPTQTLEYGHALRSGDVVCSSEKTGLTCKNDKTGRGFTMSISRYSFF